MKAKLFICLLIGMTFFTCKRTSKEEKEDIPAATEMKDKMDWWRDARFGMFIHWGLYAVPAGEYRGKRTERIGEWIMNNMHIPISEYEQYAAQFNPVKFNAEEWVSIAKKAGMKYIVITSKHHDGFCLWDSKVTDWDIMDASPFKRDILSELADACAKEDIRLCFYHSIMDWHHPDAQAYGEPNYFVRGEEYRVNPNFRRYYDNYLIPQLNELIGNYGDIGVLWFDGEWIDDYTTEMGKELYAYLLEKKPDLIINNRVDKGRQGMQGMNKEGDFAGDFGTPEQEIPDTGMPGVDWESCMTMNDTWGYKFFDDNWKSDTVLIRNLIDIASKGGNFLLNVGPSAEGIIPGPSVERLMAMGSWMNINSESIYGTQASPFEKPIWGRYTQKENKVYAHIFDWPENGKLKLSEAGLQIEKAYLLADKSKTKLQMEQAEGEFIVSLPDVAPDGIASVLVLEM